MLLKSEPDSIYELERVALEKGTSFRKTILDFPSFSERFPLPETGCQCDSTNCPALYPEGDEKTGVNLKTIKKAITQESMVALLLIGRHDQQKIRTEVDGKETDTNSRLAERRAKCVWNMLTKHAGVVPQNTFDHISVETSNKFTNAPHIVQVVAGTSLKDSRLGATSAERQDDRRVTAVLYERREDFH